jgi:hypothetical protein
VRRRIKRARADRAAGTLVLVGLEVVIVLCWGWRGSRWMVVVIQEKRKKKNFHAGFGHVGFCNSAPFPPLVFFFNYLQGFQNHSLCKTTSPVNLKLGHPLWEHPHSRIAGGSDLRDLFSTPSDTNAGLGLFSLLPQPSLQEIPAKAKGLSYLSSQRAGDPRIRPGKYPSKVKCRNWEQVSGP